MAGDRGGSWLNPFDNVAWWADNSAPARAANSFQGASGNKVVFSNPTGAQKKSAPKAAPAPAPSSGRVFSAATTTPSASGDGVGTLVDPSVAEAAGLRGEIGGQAGMLDALYAALFGDLDTLLRDRAATVESEYGKQFDTTAKQYTESIPTIENSYAAIGAADSTDSSDAKDKAKEGFDATTATIGKNKDTDLTKIGQYGNETRAKFQADRDAVKRNAARAGTTTDVDALRGLRNDLETKSGEANVARATLGTDTGARGELQRLTGDAGRFQEVQNALDTLLKGSMSDSVKQAGVKAIVDNAGLNEEDKKRAQLQFGNIYQEQNAA